MTTVFTSRQHAQLLARLTLMVTFFVLAGCAQQGGHQGASDGNAAAEATEATAAALSLQQGVQAYQSARYDVAETLLKAALQQGLGQATDVARAHKYLAFIYCTSKREALCASAFKAARQADAAFELTKTEAGHPLWGPVYRKAMGAAGTSRSR